MFEYSGLKMSQEEFFGEDSIQVKIRITSIGNCFGDEVVQLYIRDVVASIIRPVKELKALRKIALAPGESKSISFYLDKNDLSFFTPNNKWETKPGDFEMWVGPNYNDEEEGYFKYTAKHYIYDHI